MTALGEQNRAVAARAAAWLLRYPDADVLAALPVVREAIADLPSAVGAGLRAVADHLAAGDPVTIQGQYVQTFDLRRRCCLYLSYYTEGDTRGRGVALVEFSTAYRAAGMEVVGGELPDFLPAVLELASVDDAGWRLLRAHRIGLDLLVEALMAEKSRYREAVSAVRAMLPPAGPADLSAARTLAQHGPPAEMVGLEGFTAAADLPGARR